MKLKANLLIIILSIGSLTLSAQVPAALQPIREIFTSGPSGGNAPLGSSLTMFLVLGAAYGLTRLYNPTQAGEEDDDQV